MKVFPGVFLSCLFFLAAWALPAGAATTLSQIGAQIEQNAVVRAEFVQTKQMAALKKPLVTRGQLGV